MTKSDLDTSDYTRRFDSTSCRSDDPADLGRGADAPLILDEERRAISTRRERTGRGQAELTGLALSGGGIRSASFCLGVLQALDAVKSKTEPARSAFDSIDYLSTVSGGGYIGCCLTACLTKAKGAFPFNETTGGYGDTDAVHHIRDFSNYLMPRGFRDLITSIGIILCGLAANACMVLPIIFAAALLTLLPYPTTGSLCCYGRLQGIVETVQHAGVWFIPGLPLTTALLAVDALYLVIWALKRSVSPHRSTSDRRVVVSTEVSGPSVWIWRCLAAGSAIALWLDIQPIVLSILAQQKGLIACHDGPTLPKAAGFLDGALAKYLTWVTPLLSPLAAVVAFLSRNLNRAARPDRDQKWSGVLRRVLAKAALLGAAIIVPSLLWLAYLELALWLQQGDNRRAIDALLFGAILVLVALSIDPNLTSLHRLYRDRLAKAFLFDPVNTQKSATEPVGPSSVDREPINPKLHEIDTAFGPFPIINAALNIEGSAFANRRGRNADFFEFTPLFVGSEATGWRRTKSMESNEPKLDLGTALAISGAAVSPNMGSATIKALTPTLALLNLRLGFWLRNPAKDAVKPPLMKWLLGVEALAMAKEIFSHITETDDKVYVTDGGNIENLGVHALLKRRCRLIVAVDAEADPDLTFGAFLKLQRYARIDLGVLVDLPWQQIRDRTRAIASGEAADKQPAPHIAIGTIRYSPNHEDDGTLVYVKSSLTGDESDYILDYKARNPDFPHETTGDQFFGEEQLEVYRALGFHVMRLFLDGTADAAIVPRAGETKAEALTRVRSLLF